MATWAGVVLVGGRSARMGTPKAALEWQGSTLLRRTAGVLARGSGGPVVVVRAPGQELPDLPGPVIVATDPRENKGPLQGIAAGLAALEGLADIAFVAATDMPFLGPGFVRRVLGAVDDDTDVALPVVGGYRQPVAAAYRVSLAPTADRLVAEGRLKPGFLFGECRVRHIDDPDPDSVINVNTPADYERARARAVRKMDCDR